MGVKQKMFLLDEELCGLFVKRCKETGKTQTAVITDLMTQFVGPQKKAQPVVQRDGISASDFKRKFLTTANKKPKGVVGHWCSNYYCAGDCDE